jgi:hypothetical protein
MNITKALRMGGLTILVLAVVSLLIWGFLWIQLFVRFPPEHIYLSIESPDSSRIALFSVKYQGFSPWVPVDIEPNAYITVIETQHGSKLLRETEYHGTVKNSFGELARQYAPWATDQVTSLKWATLP